MAFKLTLTDGLQLNGAVTNGPRELLLVVDCYAVLLCVARNFKCWVVSEVDCFYFGII